jgi:hypothetical protein
MLPSTPTAIFNLALSYLFQKPVNDIETSPQTIIEQIGQQWYDVRRQATLMSYAPNFAIKGAAIARTGTPTVQQYPDQYAFNNDYLKLVSLYNRWHSLQMYDYQLQERDIMISNGGASSLDVWYVSDIKTLSKYPATFTTLLAADLAVHTGPFITKLPAAIQNAKDMFDRAHKAAIAANGQEQPPRRVQRSKIITAGRFPRSMTSVAGPYEFDFDPN